MPYENTITHPLTQENSVLGRAVALFLTDGAYRGLRPATLRFYRSTLGNFVWWLTREAHPLEPANLTADILKQFLLYVRTAPTRWGTTHEPAQHPTRPATEHAYGRALRAFFNWCVAEGTLSVSPLTGPNPHRPRVPLPHVPDPAIQPFTPEQVAALLATCDPATPLGVRDAALIYLLLDTMLRVGDVCRLGVGDVAVETGAWALRTGKTGRLVSGVCSPDVRRALLRWVVNVRPLVAGDRAALFVGLSARGASTLTPNGVGQMLQRRGVLAGITGVRCSPHTLRHTGAVFYLVRGGDPATLRLLLGHTTLAMTTRYLHFSQAQLATRHAQHAPAGLVDAALVARLRRAAK